MNAKLDAETRIVEEDHLALKLWLRLLTCTNLVEARLRQNLRESFNSTLPRFDLLAQLDRHPGKLRMGQLSSLMMVSGGNVTGLVAKMEQEGLVSRTPLEEDRRTFEVGLTKKGKRYFDNMARTHEAWIVDMFSELDHDQLEGLMEGLATLKGSVKSVQADG